MKPIHILPPYQDQADAGRLILRDGSIATIRPAFPDDCARFKEFLLRLSPASREKRFFSATLPADSSIAGICDSSNPGDRLTLVVLRGSGPAERIVAAGSYEGQGSGTARVVMVVDDELQGKGIGTQLLERLAVLAVSHGFVRFQAFAQSGNQEMIDVFRHSGFDLVERSERGVVEIQFPVIPTESSVHLSELRDRLSTAASLRPFFKPRSVAVIGASRKPSSIGYRILDELIRARFAGSLYPVNPNAGSICGLSSYDTVQAIPLCPDLVIVAVPLAAVLAVVDECAAKGVRALLVITAGFSEAGAEGKRIQNSLRDKVRGYGMRMIGPNCMGLMNTDPEIRLNASFSPVFPPPGTLAMSSQSGAVGLAVIALAAQRHLGLSTFVSIGNKADVSSNDLLQYWESDDATRVILLYLESFGNPRRFARIARRVSRSKPIVAVKAGRSRAGSRAAGSHTAALAANDAAVDALFQQAGVIRAETLDEMFDIGAALGSQPLPRGCRIGIVTNAGGPGILCADACEVHGLIIPELSRATQDILHRTLPPAASVANPVDMVASADAASYRITVAEVLASPDVDALVVIFIPLDRNDPGPMLAAIAEGVSEGRGRGAIGKPVLVCAMSSSLQEPLRTASEVIPVYRSPECAAGVLSKALQYAQGKASTPGIVPEHEGLRIAEAREVVARTLQSQGKGWLSPVAVKAVLDAFGIPMVPGGLARTAVEAADIADGFGYPVVAKVVSTGITHKTEVGGVRLNLADRGAVETAFNDMRTAFPEMDGMVVQKMISAAVELMIGVTSDPLFGPLIAFGLGGIHVEVLGDVQFRITPLTTTDARSMVRSIRGFRLLEGYRGHSPGDVAALEDVLLRVSRLVEEIPEIAELDLNPIVAFAPGSGCCVLDARIYVR